MSPPPSRPPPNSQQPGIVEQFKQFLKNARPQAGRSERAPDVNRVNIGEGAQVDQLAVGRNIFQAKVNIGSLVIPVRFLLVLLAVAAVLAVAVWWIVTPGQMPPGDAAANVAIVQFGAQDANGNITDSAQGAFLSDWLYNSLNRELADIPEAARPRFWHLATGFDPVHLFQKRTTAPVRNEQDAKRVAEQVGATIVIYGNLVPGQSVPAFVPQFFVAQREGEADELSGSQQLGQAIPMPLDANDAYRERTLQPIGRALVWFSRGLQNDLNGRHDLAYQILRQGEDQLTDWDENQGKEVLYYFIGREALFLANCEKDASIVFSDATKGSASAQAWDSAQHYFAQAQNIVVSNGRSYARATLGLGQVEFQRAQRELIPPGTTQVGQCRINIPQSGTLTCPEQPPPNTDPARLTAARNHLNEAIRLFNQAKEELEDTVPGRLEAKVNLNRATANTFLGTLDFLTNQPANAEPALQSAIDILTPLQQSTPRDDRRTLANVYFALGNAQFLAANSELAQNDRSTAITRTQASFDAFDACVKMIPNDDPDLFLRANQLPNCFCRRQDTQKMLDDLQ
jgi:tetratricopeptide (TPR) repeat protein